MANPSARLPFDCTDAEMERDMMHAYIADAEKWRAALEKIAGADLKRTSAGWLQQMAKEAIK